MQMALDATSAHDPESQAWHHAQLGDLHYPAADTSPTRSASIATRSSRSRIIRSPSPAWRASTRRAAISPPPSPATRRSRRPRRRPSTRRGWPRSKQAIGRPDRRRAAFRAGRAGLAQRHAGAGPPGAAAGARSRTRRRGARRSPSRRRPAARTSSRWTRSRGRRSAPATWRAPSRRRGWRCGPGPATARSCIMRRRSRRRRGIGPGRGLLVTRALDGHPTFDVVLAPEAQALLASL